MIAVCIINYHSLYDELTDHMNLLLRFAQLAYPAAFVSDIERAKFDTAARNISDMTPETFLENFWNDEYLRVVLPNVATERQEDLPDMRTFYTTRISEIDTTK
jgi:hypothetical protein